MIYCNSRAFILLTHSWLQFLPMCVTSLNTFQYKCRSCLTLWYSMKLQGMIPASGLHVATSRTAKRKKSGNTCKHSALGLSLHYLIGECGPFPASRNDFGIWSECCCCTCPVVVRIVIQPPLFRCWSSAIVGAILTLTDPTTITMFI